MTGDFELDGVTFPAAEIVLEFLDPSDDDDEGGSMFPTGNLVDDLDVPGIGTLKATMITAGIPTVFVSSQFCFLRGRRHTASTLDSPHPRRARHRKLEALSTFRELP